jgi:hypothetical protein
LAARKEKYAVDRAVQIYSLQESWLLEAAAQRLGPETVGNAGVKQGGGKQKGAGFERKICVALSQWVSAGTRKDCFWRSAMSGGRATLGLRKGDKHLSQGGDVSAIDPLGAPLTERFCVEIKFYKDLDLAAFWLGYGTLHRFWERALADAQSYGKEPMLIAKQNLYPTLVLVQGNCYLAKREQLVLWHSARMNVVVGQFDTLTQLPFEMPAIIKRWRQPV